MASGSYAKKPRVQAPAEVRSAIPARATRDLSAVGENADADSTPLSETFTFSRESAPALTVIQTDHPTQRTGKDNSIRTTSGRTTSNIARNTTSITSTKSLTVTRTPNTTQILPAELQNPNTTRVLENQTTANNTRILPTTKINRTIDIEGALTRDSRPPIRPLEKHKPWLHPWLICFIFAIISLFVLISAGMFQRVNTVSLFGDGQTYSIQVGGTQAKDWQKEKPQPVQQTIKPATGPYAVMGKPTVSADFINKVLVSANSPAAGKGQVFYDLGIQYGIDPVFALAFFQHESTFGTRGEATKTLSIGNLRCIQDHPCVDRGPNGDGYAQMDSWDDGIKTWYSLIRNLYVIQLHKDTIEKIIPTYAPSADNNNEAAYISALKYSVTRWRAGII